MLNKRLLAILASLALVALMFSASWAKPPVKSCKDKAGINHNTDVKVAKTKASTNKLDSKGAIANILSSNTSGFTSKIHVAMADTGTEFAEIHGSGGMGFKGTGGFPRIHKLGPISTKPIPGMTKQFRLAPSGGMGFKGTDTSDGVSKTKSVVTFPPMLIEPLRE